MERGEVVACIFAVVIYPVVFYFMIRSIILYQKEKKEDKKERQIALVYKRQWDIVVDQMYKLRKLRGISSFDKEINDVLVDLEKTRSILFQKSKEIYLYSNYGNE